MSQQSEEMNSSEDRPELDEKLSELHILRQSLEASRSKEKDLYDQLVRLNADFHNFRKRSESRLAEAIKAGKEAVLLQIISLCDALIQAERAIENAKDVEELKKGLDLVKAQFEKFLADQGLVAIKTQGEKMDPLRHEAVSQIVKDDVEEGVIVEEVQRGYMLNGQVIRPSRVCVSSRSSNSAQTHMKEEEQHG